MNLDIHVWRFDWAGVRPEHAERLAGLVRLYGRTGETAAHAS